MTIKKTNPLKIDKHKIQLILGFKGQMKETSEWEVVVGQILGNQMFRTSILWAQMEDKANKVISLFRILKSQVRMVRLISRLRVYNLMIIKDYKTSMQINRNLQAQWIKIWLIWLKTIVILNLVIVLL